MVSHHRPSVALIAVSVCALFVMGCAAGAGAASSVPGVFLLVAALAVGGLGCFLYEDEQSPETLNNINEPRDMGAGVWERCCTDEAVNGMCFCPAGTACNYAWTCGVDMAPDADLGPDDLGVDADMGPDADMGGAWETCCEDGKISQCFCPEGAVCNYGWFTPCDPARSAGGIECGPPTEDACGYTDEDMGQDMAPDMDSDMGADMKPDMEAGTWEPCCQGGQVGQCFCPEGVACNYGWFTTCDPARQPQVACALFEEQCNYADGGTWQPCCEDGQVSQCLCPAGAACNYGFTACDPAVSGVACVPARVACPVTM